MSQWVGVVAQVAITLWVLVIVAGMVLFGIGQVIQERTPGLRRYSGTGWKVSSVGLAMMLGALVVMFVLSVIRTLALVWIYGV